MRREVGAGGYPCRFQRGGEGDGGSPLAVSPDDLDDTEALLGLTKKREEALDTFQAEGNLAAAVELLADTGKAGEGESGARFARRRVRDTLRGGG